jgi:hypothetical protein
VPELDRWTDGDVEQFGELVASCDQCAAELGVRELAWLEHHVDGSHTVRPWRDLPRRRNCPVDNSV